MSADPEEVAALARAFARQLEFLRSYRGVHYLGAANMLAPELEGDGDPASSPATTPAERRAAAVGGGERTFEQSVYSEPRGVQSEVAKSGESSAPSSAPAPVRDGARKVISTQAGQWSAARKLEYLRERNVGDCHRCALAQTRRSIVFGVGDPDADLMFVGEAPGADEDRLGEPFVGAAGQRLNQWLEELGLARAQVYIANVLKCRPPGNRDPKPPEIERCSPFLHAQVRAIEPKVIVALGRFAGCLLLGRDMKMYEMRGQVHRYREPKSGRELPLVVTYHPSYVLRREREPQGARARPDRDGVIKSEDQKVLADLERAVSLVRPHP